MSLSPTPSTATPSKASGRSWQVGTLVYSTAGLSLLFCWLLCGDFAWQLKERSAPPVVQLMLRTFEASDLLTGLFLVSLPAAFGVILTPIVSYRSDRHRGRWGRRIPYLLITSPIAAVGMYGLAFSPLIGRWLHAGMGWDAKSLNLTIILVLGCFWTIFEFSSILAQAMFGGLINDVVPRELIGRFFGMFRAVSLVTGMVFNYYLIGHAKEHFVGILVGIGTLYSGGLVLMCLMVKEGEYPPPENRERAPSFIAAIRSYFRDCFTNPYYVLVFTSIALANLAMMPVNLFSVYAAESFGLTMDSYGKTIVVIYLFSLMLSYPLGWMADRFHALPIGLVALAAYAVTMAAGFFAVKGPDSFRLFFLLHGVVAGCYLTGAAALGQMLFPKLKFAQFASACGMMLALTNFILGPLLGLMLDHLDHDYRYTFGIASLVTFMALVVSLVVYRRFKALGGPHRYVAPE